MIVSFIAEGVIGNYIAIPLILFTLYYKNNRCAFWIGLLYDIVYTNTLFLNAFLFAFISYLIKKIKDKNIFYFVGVITIYHIASYLILLLFHSNLLTTFYLMQLLKNIVVSIIVLLLFDKIHKHSISRIFYIGDTNDSRGIFKKKKQKT